MHPCAVWSCKLFPHARNGDTHTHTGMTHVQRAHKCVCVFIIHYRDYYLFIYYSSLLLHSRSAWFVEFKYFFLFSQRPAGRPTVVAPIGIGRFFLGSVDAIKLIPLVYFNQKSRALSNLAFLFSKRPIKSSVGSPNMHCVSIIHPSPFIDFTACQLFTHSRSLISWRIFAIPVH